MNDMIVFHGSHYEDPAIAQARRRMRHLIAPNSNPNG